MNCNFPYLNKYFMFFVFISCFQLGLNAQKPMLVSAKSHPPATKMAGVWEFNLEKGKSILILSQTGNIAIGTFDDAPVIVNIFGDKVKFKCDKREASGEKIRYTFNGQIEDAELKGKMTVYSYSNKSLDFSEFKAVRAK